MHRTVTKWISSSKDNNKRHACPLVFKRGKIDFKIAKNEFLINLIGPVDPEIWIDEVYYELISVKILERSGFNMPTLRSEAVL